jgi:hypothetical protein
MIEQEGMPLGDRSGGSDIALDNGPLAFDLIYRHTTWRKLRPYVWSSRFHEATLQLWF